jgi:catalase
MASPPERAVNAINGVFGRHPACRAAHARGSLATGVFTATEAAARLTPAAHMQGAPVGVTARFSNASGDPGSPDGARDARGLAVKFHLDHGDTDIVAVTLPCFFVREPGHFVALNKAMRPRRLRLLRVAAFALRHPETWRALFASARLGAVPSYANCRYQAIHAFRWVSADGEAVYVRYSWLPDEGEARVGWRAARRLEFDHLQQDLYNRIGRTPPRPMRFILQLELATPEEVASGRAFDPTKIWSPKVSGEERERVDAGLLELDAIRPGGAGEDAALVFDPTNVTDGIEVPRNDAILCFRPAAYKVSSERRGAV